jgi:2-dehydro-3-deoxyphosphogalactonate aldolase
MSHLASFDKAFAVCPLIAILRGLKPDEAVSIGEALVEAGITILEVPLNSPEPFVSIEKLAKALQGRAVVGAGTVYRRTEVDRVMDAGGTLIVSPNTNIEVIAHSATLGLVSAPGIFTPTEAIAALDAGATILKIFPGELMSSAGVKALSAVLPRGTRMALVGGVNEQTFAQYKSTPLAGYGIGSSLYSTGVNAHEIGERARRFIKAYKDSRS